MQFDSYSYRYPSRRELVFAKKGMVCASQPLAAQAGLDMIKRGGNAVDAAIAAAACMTVLEPTSNGVGGDCFALVWMEDSQKLYGLNASGRAPRSLTVDEVLRAGYTEMPRRGWIPVMVPGEPAGWAALNERFGRLSLEAVLAPAVAYAREGYPVSPLISQLWAAGFKLFDGIREDCFEPWFEMFAPHGRSPAAGELWKSEELADTLERIGRTRARDFYRGELADKISDFSKATGGFIRKEDLTGYECEWVEPIHVQYKGVDVWELPPNGIGIIALMALKLLNEFDLKERDSADTFHKQIEALKLAFADGKRYVADMDAMKVTKEELLSEDYAKIRRELIGETAGDFQAGSPACGGTVYLCAADGDGNMVSFIQSNYNGFGSGIVVPGTGISLQNRGAAFSLDQSGENCLAPGKRVFHTIIPGFLTKDGRALGPFGVMGAFMQPQGHVQVVMNLIDFHLNPQEALDAPRWQWIRGKEVMTEPSMPEKLIEELRRKGHTVTRAEDSLTFGRGQIILRDENGVLCGATEPRAGGTVAAW